MLIMKGEKMESTPYLNKNVSCQVSSIQKNKGNSKNKQASMIKSIPSSPKTSKQTKNKTNEEPKAKSTTSSPLQINIPYFNIQISSTELLNIAKSVVIQTLLKKIQDPVFLMNLLNSEGGKKIFSLVGNVFNDTSTKSEKETD